MSELRLVKEQVQPLRLPLTAEPLLVTKLQPPSFTTLCPRPRLTERFTPSAAVTLITAPAGCGKTTLLAELLSGASGTYGWVTLDEHDNDAFTLMSYLCAALSITAESGSTEGMLALLINTVAEAGTNYWLFLDDFDRLTSADAYRVLAYLLAHLPPNLHVVIAARTPPALPYARLRAQRRLLHLRAADLAFTPEETGAFFEHAAGGVDIEPTLARELNGWAAGLALLGEVCGETESPVERARRFRQYVREYVAQEILTSIPEDRLSFLLRTAVLHELTVDSCTAITGRADARMLLDAFCAEGLFIRQTDADSYEYAPFFREALREHFTHTAPALAAALIETAEAGTDEGERDALFADVPLSEREREVLALLANGHSSPEIAQRMIIAVSTVKTHIKHIYRKLNVDNRYQAMKRARELNLLQIEMEERYRQMMR